MMRKNAPLTAQLSNAMRMNLDMAKKLNIKPTQEPENNRLAEKVKRKAAFDKNLDTDGY